MAAVFAFAMAVFYISLPPSAWPRQCVLGLAWSWQDFGAQAVEGWEVSPVTLVSASPQP